VQAEPTPGFADRVNVLVNFVATDGRTYPAYTGSVPRPAAAAMPAVGKPWPDPVLYDPRAPGDGASLRPYYVYWWDVWCLVGFAAVLAVLVFGLPFDRNPRVVVQTTGFRRQVIRFQSCSISWHHMCFIFLNAGGYEGGTTYSRMNCCSVVPGRSASI
jgi:hypothetical protein